MYIIIDSTKGEFKGEVKEYLTYDLTNNEGPTFVRFCDGKTEHFERGELRTVSIFFPTTDNQNGDKK